MTDQMVAQAGVPCAWCGQCHGVRCPYVKHIEFMPNSSMVASVTYFSPLELGESFATLNGNGDPPDEEASYDKLAPIGGGNAQG